MFFTKRMRDVIGPSAIGIERASNANKPTMECKKIYFIFLPRTQNLLINFKFAAKNIKPSLLFMMHDA